MRKIIDNNRYAQKASLTNLVHVAHVLFSQEKMIFGTTGPFFMRACMQFDAELNRSKSVSCSQTAEMGSDRFSFSFFLGGRGEGEDRTGLKLETGENPSCRKTNAVCNVYRANNTVRDPFVMGPGQVSL